MFHLGEAYPEAYPLKMLLHLVFTLRKAYPETYPQSIPPKHIVKHPGLGTLKKYNPTWHFGRQV